MASASKLPVASLPTHGSTAKSRLKNTAKMVLSDYTYVFVIGTLFAMLDAYNNGASECTVGRTRVKTR